jgi:hypothetical protein
MGFLSSQMNIENELDLESLFQPAWAKQPADANQYARFTGNEGAERRGDRPFRPGADRGGRPAGRPREGGFRPQGQGQGGPRGQGGGGPRGPRPEGDRGPRRDGGNRGPGGQRGDFRGGPRRDDRRPEPPPALELNFSIIPEEKGVDSLARQIKLTGRAYPLFDIAQLIVQKPERYQIKIDPRKNAEGVAAQPLFICALDESVWLTEQEAVGHILKDHFSTFYQAEKTPCDAPKGVYTFVAQCGMSGEILGPPNYHDYQNQLRRLHQSRFDRMPFEAFKSRVKIVKDEEVVKKWIEDQSFKTEYVALNLPEPLRLSKMEDVEKHFREVHLPNIVKRVDSHVLTGVASRNVRQPALMRNLRHLWEEQRRFPLSVVNILSSQLASRGLQFFKVNKTVTHVSVARPHFLDLETNPVSPGIRKIVEFINATPKANRKLLIEALAPFPAAAAQPAAPAAETAPAPAPTTDVEGSAAAPAEAAPVAAPAEPEAPQPTSEQRTLIGDLHWLIHQGHVIEFHNGVLETAKKPAPKPQPQPKKEKPAKAPKAEAAPATEQSAAETSPAAESVPAEAPAVEPAAEAPPAPEAPEAPAEPKGDAPNPS